MMFRAVITALFVVLTFGKGGPAPTVTATVPTPDGVAAVASGGASKFSGSTLSLNTPAVSGDGLLIVFVTTVLNNDDSPVPATSLNGASPVGWAEKAVGASRRLDVFTVPTSAVPLSVSWASPIAGRVSWTVAVTNRDVTSVTASTDSGLVTSHTVPGSTGMFVSGVSVGVGKNEPISHDSAADGWQRGTATIGQTFTQWAETETDLTTAWSTPAHAVGLTVTLSGDAPPATTTTTQPATTTTVCGG